MALGADLQTIVERLERIERQRLTIEDPDTHRVLLELGTEKIGIRNYARLQFFGDDGKESSKLDESGIRFQYQDQNAHLGFAGLSMVGGRTSIIFNQDGLSYSNAHGVLGAQLGLLPTTDGGLNLVISSGRNEFGALVHGDAATAYVASPKGTVELGADGNGTWITPRPPSP